MRKFNRKQKIAIAGIAGATAIALGGGVAYAYWSTSGSGTGSGATSAGASNLTVAQTSTISGLAPGVAAQTISGTVTNNAGNNAYVTFVTVSIASVTQAAGATGTCTSSDYSLLNPQMQVKADIAPNGTANFSGATLAFNNSSTANQDGCKGATVNLSYAAS